MATTVTTEQLVASFTAAQEALGCAPRTREDRARTIRRFAAHTELLAATPEEVESFLAALSVTQRSRVRTRSHLALFYRWAVAQGLVPGSPVGPSPSSTGRPRTPRSPLTPDNADLLAAWILNCERRNLRPRSIARMRDNAERFASHIHPRPLLDATRADIEEWLDSCDVGPESRRGYGTYLRVLYRWAVDEQLLGRAPTVGLAIPKMRRRLPRPVDEGSFAEALAEADPRMRAWLCLAGFTGLRCQEIAGLRRDDILDEHTPPLLLVRQAKGGNERMIPLHPEVVAALDALPLPRSGYLFPHTYGGGRPIEPHSVSHKIGRYLADCGIEAGAHRFRHRFATMLYAASGHDLRVTQEMLGHASPATTAIYAAFSPTDATAAVLALPVAR